MRYMLRPKTVEAYLFELGTEDGFLRESCYIPADSHEFAQDYRSKIYPRYHKAYESTLNNILRCGKLTEGWKPYIEFPNGGKIGIPFGSYIVSRDGDIEIYTKEDFDKDFFPCEE